MLSNATSRGRRLLDLVWPGASHLTATWTDRPRIARLLQMTLLLVGLLCVGRPLSGLAADLFTELRSFPGVVLLPADTLVPFDGLEPWRVELNRPLPNSLTPPHGRYLVQYRERGASGSGGSGSAQVGGTIGGAEFDDALRTLSTLSFKRCAAEAAYCTENVGGQDGTAPASEVFRGLAVGDAPAVAEHVICCGGHYWSLTWYDAGRDMTYELVLVGSIADRYGDTIAPENASMAQAIAGLAGQLAPLE